jgi:phospholipid/cholesterol/gamma-HCH transport system substrate-binding protein
MRIKFNKFERVAGLFVFTAIAGVAISSVFVAIKRDWFSPKVQYSTEFINGEGVHPGTAVQIAGLRAGSVEDVELKNDNKIRLTFTVLSKFQDRIRKDSVAQLIRPFIIGDRILEISVGTEENPMLAEHESLNSHETMDMMSIFSGRKLGEYLSMMSGMVENLKVLAEAFLDKKRTESVVKTFDQIEPLVKNLNLMSVEVVKLAKQVTQKENLGNVIGNLVYTTNHLNAIIPELQQKAPQMSQDLATIVTNLAVLTENFKLITPAIAEVAPDLPRSSRRALEALDEAVVLLKAMQKSIFIRGSVEEVRETELAEGKAPKKGGGSAGSGAGGGKSQQPRLPAAAPVAPTQ